MPVIESLVDTRSEEFRANRARMLELVERFRALEKRVRDNSASKARKFHERGQVLPRERVERLLDRGAPFLELSTLAGFGMHDDDGGANVSGGGNVCGIGFVSGRRVIVLASDSAIKGGTISPMGLRKTLRAQEVALVGKLPMVNLIESGGANLIYQSEIFVEGGRVFANMARLSAAGIPQVTIVHGSSTAGGAYLPGLSDYVVVVRGKSRIFLAGPPLVKAATGEDATDEDLGGAEMHSTVSGTAEYMADDDAGAIRIVREILGKIPWDERVPTAPAPAARPPRYDPEDLAGIVPVDYRKPYDVREVVARIADDSDFLEFKAPYGPETVCGHARIEGHACGIAGNNGPIHPAGAVKAAHFIQACCQSGTPIVYLQNITGYMVGLEAEKNGMVKHGSKMIQAVANATVPQITVVIGASFGAGNYGMCGRSYDPRFIFSWPNAQIAVMGGEQAARVMEIITEAKFERSGAPPDRDGLRQMSRGLRDKLDAESTALYATARLWDDGIIDPRDTRRVLGFALAVCREADGRRLRPSTFGVARM
ncbi:MAG: carboxyl transferase domain-containing protein [Myxococcota bacterium]|nr:carboxyl transferase domain-containing protein [Myxococcota bacterium]